MSNQTDNDPPGDALSWLNGQMAELSAWPEGKYGEDIVLGLKHRILLYNADRRREIDEALAKWVLGGDRLKASIGITLLVDLRAKSQLRALHTLRDQLVDGQKAFLAIPLKRVENAIKALSGT